jgi:hypothetical protein
VGFALDLGLEYTVQVLTKVKHLGLEYFTNGFSCRHVVKILINIINGNNIFLFFLLNKKYITGQSFSK